MSEMLEHYTSGVDNSRIDAYGPIIVGQTFTPSVDHEITEVVLKLSRTGSPGMVTISVRATDVDGKPTGADLCSVTFNPSSIGATGEWFGLDLDDSYTLLAGTKYAILLSAPNGNSSNYIGWRGDSSAPGYSGGSLAYNNGSSWTLSTAFDMFFQEWGYSVVIYTQDTGEGSMSPSSALSRVMGKAVGSGALAISSIIDFAMAGMYFKSVGAGVVAISGYLSKGTKRLAGFINLLFRNHKKPNLTFRGG
jgi:hypothetical protein